MYLVTGGAGFIGSHIVERLRSRGEAVRIADDFSSGRRENVPAGVDVVEGDLADPAVAKKAVAGCEFVIHQAAIPSVPRSVNDPVRSHRANVDGTLNVLIAARDAGAKRLVFAGSSSVYGDAAVLPKREDMRPAPLFPTRCRSWSASSIARCSRGYRARTVVTGYFNVFGPRQQPVALFGSHLALHRGAC
jgi:nucleoside-diphosphate-sugar epimerase